MFKNNTTSCKGNNCLSAYKSNCNKCDDYRHIKIVCVASGLRCGASSSTSNLLPIYPGRVYHFSKIMNLNPANWIIYCLYLVARLKICSLLIFQPGMQNSCKLYIFRMLVKSGKQSWLTMRESQPWVLLKY